MDQHGRACMLQKVVVERHIEFARLLIEYESSAVGTVEFWC